MPRAIIGSPFESVFSIATHSPTDSQIIKDWKQVAELSQNLNSNMFQNKTNRKIYVYLSKSLDSHIVTLKFTAAFLFSNEGFNDPACNKAILTTAVAV